MWSHVLDRVSRRGMFASQGDSLQKHHARLGCACSLSPAQSAKITHAAAILQAAPTKSKSPIELRHQYCSQLQPFSEKKISRTCVSLHWAGGGVRDGAGVAHAYRSKATRRT